MSDAAAPSDIRSGAIESDLRALGLEVEPPAVAALAAYLGLLEKWNGTFNLTSVRAPQAMRIQHLADCLAVVGPLRRHEEARRNEGRLTRPLHVLDVGSGGGLPGVVLAAMNPSWQVHCIDAVAKKTAFVRQVAGELGLTNLQATHGRIERFQRDGGFDVVVSRAFASLTDFVDWSHHVLAPDGVWLAMKGKEAEAAVGERCAANAEVMAIEVLRPPGMEASRCLVWIRHAADESI